MDIIKSKDNKTIKYISKLISSSKFRRDEQCFVTEGVRLCTDAVDSGAKVDFLLYTDSAEKKYHDAIVKISSVSEKIAVADDRIFSSISDTKTPQGVLCVVKTLDKTTSFGKIINNGKVLALDNIQDPSNMGTILRSADALGISSVVLSNGCCDVYSPKVVRGSMGAVFRIPFIITDDLPGFIAEFNKNGESYAAVLNESAARLNDVSFIDNTVVVIGNEGNGISKEVIDACNNTLYIDMHNNAESLNAAVAASIIMWEMIK